MRLIIKTCLVLTFFISGFASAQSRGGAPAGAGAGFYFEETFFPVYVHRNDTTQQVDAPGVATENGLGWDFRTTIGYTFMGSWLAGLSYNMYTLTTSRPLVTGGADSLDEKTTKSEFGPTIGYLNSGWRFLLTVLVSGTKEVDTKHADASGPTGDEAYKYTGMSGFEFTAGYSFPIFSNTELGPTVVYRNVSYKKQSKANRLSSLPGENYDSTPLYSKAVEGDFNAMISLVVRF